MGRLARGEETAGLLPAQRRSSVDTDKDGIVPALLSAEITARRGRDPGERIASLCASSASRWPIASKRRQPPRKSAGWPAVAAAL